MRVLIAHVRYRNRGGEDIVVDTESRILSEAGHAVTVLDPESASLDSLPAVERLRIGASGGRHAYGRELVRRAIERSGAQVVHFHNLYPLFGSGAMQEAAALGCGVVQTIHSTRLTCMAGTNLADGLPCTRCGLHSRLPGVLRGCYRGSRLQSAAMGLALARQARLLCSLPHVLMPLTTSAAQRLIAEGTDPARILVKPNSVEDGCGGDFDSREGVAFVGRLSAEKGVLDLVRAWPGTGPVLKVAGDGPQRDELASAAALNGAVSLLGSLGRDETRAVIRSSRVLVVPSAGAEGMPLAVLEALSERTPVVILGGEDRVEIVGSVRSVVPTLESLVAAACRLAESRDEWDPRSQEAYRTYSERYTHVANLSALEAAYGRAVSLVASRAPR